MLVFLVCLASPNPPRFRGAQVVELHESKAANSREAALRKIREVGRVRDEFFRFFLGVASAFCYFKTFRKTFPLFFL